MTPTSVDLVDEAFFFLFGQPEVVGHLLGGHSWAWNDDDAHCLQDDFADHPIWTVTTGKVLLCDTEVTSCHQASPARRGVGSLAGAPCTCFEMQEDGEQQG